MEVEFSFFLDAKLDGSTGGLVDGCSCGRVELSFGSDESGRTVSFPISSSLCDTVVVEEKPSASMRYSLLGGASFLGIVDDNTRLLI
jgi:hypothetical protein